MTEKSTDGPRQGLASETASPASSGTRTIDLSRPSRELTLFLVAGEHSGDALGGKLMHAIRRERRGRVRFLGVGGPRMAAEGLISQFPLSDVAVMGPLAILRRLPTLIQRVHQTVDAAIAADPDAVVVIDSPEFTQPIAKRIHQRRADLPIINYVSPSVWAWRPGRARRMRHYINHVMALLPFEPEAHKRLNGPPCTYVGHPLIEEMDVMANVDAEPLRQRLKLLDGMQVLVVLPGSRRSEIDRLMRPFGEAVGHLTADGRRIKVVIPAVEHLSAAIKDAARSWAVDATIVTGEADKLAAFKLARAALAASGTVTLELGLVGTPMVVAYRVDALAACLRFLVKTPHFALANLILGERAFPELMQQDCTGPKLADALRGLLDETPERQAQLAALARIPALMQLPQGTPSEAAAKIVTAHADRSPRR